MAKSAKVTPETLIAKILVKNPKALVWAVWVVHGLV
jgi:hypothetical protein